MLFTISTFEDANYTYFWYLAFYPLLVCFYKFLTTFTGHLKNSLKTSSSSRLKNSLRMSFSLSFINLILICSILNFYIVPNMLQENYRSFSTSFSSFLKNFFTFLAIHLMTFVFTSTLKKAILTKSPKMNSMKNMLTIIDILK